MSPRRRPHASPLLLLLLALYALSACSNGATTVDGGAADSDGALADAAADVTIDSNVVRGPGIYIVGARIIDGRGGPPLLGKALLIRGDRVVAIETPRPSSDPTLERIDVAGRTLMPGLVDGHAHLALDLSRADAALAALIDHGITSVRDLGAPLDDSVKLRSDIASGSRVGPRLFVAGPIITHPNGHPIATFWAGDPQLQQSAGRAVSTVAEARAAVGPLATGGVDFIKAVYTNCNTNCERMTKPLLAAVIDEAHLGKLRVSVHTDSPTEVQEAVESGADAIEHGSALGPLTAQTVAAIAAAGTFFVSTYSVYDTPTSPADTKAMLDNLRALHAAKAKVLVGSDAPNEGAAWGKTVVDELEQLVNAGFSPMEAIVAATRTASELLGEADLGTIEEGKLADVIAVDGDPLADVAALSNVALVIKGGRVLVNKLP